MSDRTDSTAAGTPAIEGREWTPGRDYPLAEATAEVPRRPGPAAMLPGRSAGPSSTIGSSAAGVCLGHVQSLAARRRYLLQSL